jgi:hypothetical protein
VGPLDPSGATTKSLRDPDGRFSSQDFVDGEKETADKSIPKEAYAAKAVFDRNSAGRSLFLLPTGTLQTRPENIE